MKYILLLLLFPFCLVSAEESYFEENGIDRTPVYFYRGGRYYSTGVLCRYPNFHIRRFAPCPYYYHHWEYRINFNTERPVNQGLIENVTNFHFESFSGDANAQSFLASYYERGLGVPMDLSKAYAWHKISAGNGNEVSRYKLEKLIPRVSPEVIEEGEKHVIVFSEQIASFKEDIEEESSLSEEIEDSMLFSQKNALSNTQP